MCADSVRSVGQALPFDAFKSHRDFYFAALPPSLQRSKTLSALIQLSLDCAEQPIPSAMNSLPRTVYFATNITTLSASTV